MMKLPVLSDKQRRILTTIDSDRHVILFDLEVQELEQMGLIEGSQGYYIITDLGYDVLTQFQPFDRRSGRGDQEGSPTSALE